MSGACLRCGSAWAECECAALHPPEPEPRHSTPHYQRDIYERQVEIASRVTANLRALSRLESIVLQAARIRAVAPRYSFAFALRCARVAVLLDDARGRSARPRS